MKVYDKHTFLTGYFPMYCCILFPSHMGEFCFSPSFIQTVVIRDFMWRYFPKFSLYCLLQRF